MSNTSNNWKSQGGINRRSTNNILSNSKQSISNLTIPQQFGISNTTVQQYGDKRDMDNSSFYKLVQGEQNYDNIIAYYPFNNLMNANTNTNILPTNITIKNQSLHTRLANRNNFDLSLNYANNLNTQNDPYFVYVPDYSQNAIQFRNNSKILISANPLNTINTLGQTENNTVLSTILTFETFVYIPSGTTNFCIFALDDISQHGLFLDSTDNSYSTDCFYLWYKGDTFGNQTQMYYKYNNNNNTIDISNNISNNTCGELSPDKWHKLMVVFGGSYIAIYIDGKQTKMSLTPGGSYIPDKPIAFNLGNLYSNVNAYYESNIAYDGILSKTNRQQTDNNGPMLLDARISLKANTKEFIEYLANPGNGHKYATSRIPNSNQDSLIYLLSNEFIGFNANLTCESDVIVNGELTTYGETSVYAQSNFYDTAHFHGNVIFDSSASIVYDSSYASHINIFSSPAYVNYNNNNNASLLIQNAGGLAENKQMPSMLVYNSINPIKDITNTHNLIFSISGDCVSIGPTYGTNMFNVDGNSLFNGDANITGNLNIIGNTTHGGGDFAHDGTMYVNNLTISGQTTLTGKVDIYNNVSIDGSLNITNDANINGLTVGVGGGDISSNCVIGQMALSQNMFGKYNSAFGNSAGESNVNGDYNTYIGYGADNSGNNNYNNSTAIGYDAKITSSDQIVLGRATNAPTVYIPGNVGIGTDNSGSVYALDVSGSLNVSNDANINGLTVGVGGGDISSNCVVGQAALSQNTAGSYNSAFGYLAGASNITGNNNTYLGYNSTADANNYNNSTALGYLATITHSDQIVLGRTTNAPTVYIPGKVGVGIDNQTGAYAVDINGGVRMDGSLNVTSGGATINGITTFNSSVYGVTTNEYDDNDLVGNKFATLNWVNWFLQNGGGLWRLSNENNTHMYNSDFRNVGIGTMNPNYTLDVSGGVNISNGLDVSGGATIHGKATLKDGLDVSGVTRFYNAVIGQTDKSYNDNNGTTFATLDWVDWYINYEGGVWSVDASNSQIIHNTNLNTLVGIGTTSPSTTLDVSGGVNISNGLDVSGGAIIDGGAIINSGLTVNNGGATINGVTTFNNYVHGVTTQEYDNTIGNTFATLDWVDWYINYEGGVWSVDASNSQIIHNTNLNTLVGIGTTNPKTTLDVSGGVKISNHLDVSGGAIIDGGAIINSGLTVNNELTVNNGAKINGSMTVESSITLNGSMEVSNDMSIKNGRMKINDDGVTIYSDTEISGNTIMDGYAVVKKHMGVGAGVYDISYALLVTGDMKVKGDIIHTGSIDIGVSGEKINMTGEITLNGPTTHIGDHTHMGGIMSIDILDVSGGGKIGGQLDISSGCSVGGRLDVSGGATITGISVFNDPVTGQTSDNMDGTGKEFATLEWVNNYINKSGLGGWTQTDVSGNNYNIHNVNGGNVGIGTERPETKLDVHGTLNVQNDVTMRGKVNITTGPLDVSGGATIDNGITIHGASSFSDTVTGRTSSDVSGTEFATLEWVNNRISKGGLGGWTQTDVSGNYNIHNANGGNVGIGTDSPETKLDVHGTLNVQNDVTMRGKVNITTGPLTVSGPTSFTDSVTGKTSSDVSGTEFATLEWVNNRINNSGLGGWTETEDVSGNYNIHNVNNGNVGIGTGTDIPQSKLDVRGGLYVSSDASINGITVGLGGGDLSSNSVVGQSALFSNTTGLYNSAFGQQTLYSNTTGSNNSAFGQSALYSNTSGSGNIAIGYNSGETNQTGSNNTYIGNGADCTDISYNNSTAIGYLAQITKSDQIVFGQISNGNVVAPSVYIPGNVGIGTDTPQTKLDVVGGVYVRDNLDVSGIVASSKDAMIHGLTVGRGGANKETNSVFGETALSKNTQGLGNTAIGYAVLDNNNIGNFNTAIGAYSGQNNQSGEYNTYLGYGTDCSNNNYVNSTAVGYNAMITSSNQIVLGKITDNSGNAPTVYIPGNVGIGTDNSGSVYALDVSGSVYVDGSLNIINGANIGGTTQFYGNVYGQTSSDVSGTEFATLDWVNGKISTDGGGWAAANITNGYIDIHNTNFGGNVGIGTTVPTATLDVSGTMNVSRTMHVSGTMNVSADAIIHGHTVGRGGNSQDSNSLAVGNGSLSVAPLTASHNTAIGSQSLNRLSSGNNNTAVGYLAGYGIVNFGDNNTFLGYATGAISNYSRSTAIGFGATITTNDQIVLGTNGSTFLGNAPIPTVYIPGRVGIGKTNPVTALDVSGTITATNFNATSDLRLKDNINDLSNSLEKICAIRGVEYTWKGDDTKKLQSGVIAQEVNMIIPEAVNTSNPDTLTVNYNAIIGHLIESIKTLKQEVDNLKSQLPRV